MGESQLPDLTPYRFWSEKEFDLKGDPVGSGSRIRNKRGSGTTIEGSGIGIISKVDLDQEWDAKSRSKSGVGDNQRTSGLQETGVLDWRYVAGTFDIDRLSWRCVASTSCIIRLYRRFSGMAG